MAMVGSVVHLRAFRKEALAHFWVQPECSGANAESFLQQCEADPDGRHVLEDIDVLLLNNRPVGEKRHLRWLLAAEPNRRGGVEVDSENLGHVLATGSGAVGMIAAVDAVDTNTFGGIGPKKDWNCSHDATARTLMLIARMHKVDELTAQMLLEYWGWGYEVIHREASNGLVFLKDYTILFWALDPDLGRRPAFSSAACPRPARLVHLGCCESRSAIFVRNQPTVNTHVIKRARIDFPTPRSGKQSRQYGSLYLLRCLLACSCFSAI